MPHGVELMVARQNFIKAAAFVAENRKVAQQRQEAALFEHAFDDCRQLRLALWRDVVALNGTPGHEALVVGRERADARQEAV